MKKILLIISLFVSAMSVSAQENVLKEVNTTAVDSLIKRLPSNALYEYADFQSGVAYFKDGTKSSAKFNYSVLYDEMHYKEMNGEITALGNGQDIGMIKIGADTYVFVGNKAFAKMIMYNSNVMLCLKRHTRITADEGNYGAYGTSTETVSASKVQRNMYNPSVKDLNEYRDLKYEVEDEYILIVDGKKNTVRSKKAFEKAFPRLKKQIKEYLSENKLDFDKGEDILKMMQVCVSLEE